MYFPSLPTHTLSSSGTMQWNRRTWNRTISTRTSSRSRSIVYPPLGHFGGCSPKEILRGGWLEVFQGGVFRVHLPRPALNTRQIHPPPGRNGSDGGKTEREA